MRPFRFRALIAIESAEASAPVRGYHSGTRALMVHVSRIGHLAGERYFPATMTWDEPGQLRPGDRAVVTITVTDEEAPAYLGAGQTFTLWGGGSGRGVITRQVFTSGSPS